MKGCNLLNYYYSEQTKAQEKYGTHTVVFLQNGAFYEAYQYGTNGYNLHRLSELLNFVVTRKNKSKELSLECPYMFGIPVIVWEKNLKVLVENGYTIVQIDEVTQPPHPRRDIVAVHSPGTYITDITNPDSSYICSIHIEEGRKEYECGATIMDTSTGKIYMSESRSEKDDSNMPLDDIVKIIQTYQCKEIIITTCNMVTFTREQLISFLEVVDKLHFYREVDNSEVLKLKYQERRLLDSFGHLFIQGERENMIETMNLELLTYARISLVSMLDYVKDHNTKLIIKLDVPTILLKSEHLYLGNNAIYQLNIFNNDQSNMSNLYYKGEQYKCLFDIINKTSTTIGRRYLKNTIINPLLDVDFIRWRYDVIELWQNKIDDLEIHLNGIMDIERYGRKIALQTLHPLDMYKCVVSLEKAYNLLKYARIDMPHVCSCGELLGKLELFFEKIGEMLDVDELAKYLLNDINGPIFKKGVYDDLDAVLDGLSGCNDSIYETCASFNKVLSSLQPKKKQTDDKTFIKVVNNSKEGHYYETTKLRGEQLQRFMQTEGLDNVNIEDVTFKLINNKTMRIYMTNTSNVSERMDEMMETYKKVVKEKYINLLGEINVEYGSMIMNVVEYVGEIDFLKSGAKCAKLNKYCKPEIEDTMNRSYMKAVQMRHPICEKLLKNSEYVPVDIEIGTEKQNGILLFGLNSAGKSTLQKSIGVNILMAQIGYYVAASSFVYYPYNNLMTRISGNDNMFKHMSSFEVEMNELKAILKRSTKNTLIIADEVCRGTEHRGSLTIVMTMLELLIRKQCSFITATHLHDLLKIERLERINGLKMYHLHMDYDETNNVIVYDRNLREGPGRSEYGFQLAKFLINDSEFICHANEIDAEINKNYEKQSKYNPNVWVTECQICGYKPTKRHHKPLETHHIKFQKDADEDGFLLEKPHMHKNNRTNLCVLCDACHDKIDTNELVIHGYKETSNGLELCYVLNE